MTPDQQFIFATGYHPPMVGGALICGLVAAGGQAGGRVAPCLL